MVLVVALEILGTIHLSVILMSAVLLLVLVECKWVRRVAVRQLMELTLLVEQVVQLGVS